MRKMTKKSKVLAAAGALALVAGGGGAAVAYWTTLGSGYGTATNSEGNGTVTLHANFADELSPGNTVDVLYTADNSSNTGTKVGALSATVTTSVGACLPAWFTVSALTDNALVAANTSGTQVGTGVLEFLNSDDNQDACKGAAVTITVGSHYPHFAGGEGTNTSRRRIPLLPPRTDQVRRARRAERIWVLPHNHAKNHHRSESAAGGSFGHARFGGHHFRGQPGREPRQQNKGRHHPGESLQPDS
jgi:hypothetical protein